MRLVFMRRIIARVVFVRKDNMGTISATARAPVPANGSNEGGPKRNTLSRG
jgi:hypothetical protein